MFQAFTAIPAIQSGVVNLSQCVAGWLESTGKRQKAIAKIAGLSPSKFSEIVTGQNPNPQWETVEKLAKGFGVSVAVFVAGAPRPEEKAGREHAGNQRNAILEKRYAELSAGVDIDFPAEDSIEGDIHKAIAVLNRALRRPQRSATEALGTPRRRAAPDS